MKAPSDQPRLSYPIDLRAASGMLGRDDALLTPQSNGVHLDTFHARPGPSERTESAFINAAAQLYGLTEAQVRNDVLATQLGVHLLGRWMVGEVKFPSELPVYGEPPKWVAQKFAADNCEPPQGTFQPLKLDKRPEAKPPRTVNAQLADTPLGEHKSVAEAYEKTRAAALKKWADPGIGVRARNEISKSVAALDQAYQGCNRKELARSGDKLDFNEIHARLLEEALKRLRQQIGKPA